MSMSADEPQPVHFPASMFREIVLAVGMSRNDDAWRACCWDMLTALNLLEQGDPDHLKHVGKP